MLRHLFVAVTGLVAFACAHSAAVLSSGPGWKARTATIAVAPSELLSEVPGAAPHDPCTDGLYVGHVHHSGGYVIEAVATGEQVRSKETRLTAQDEYGAQIRGWVDATVIDVLAGHGHSTVLVPALDATRLPAPRRSPIRGSVKEDGQDNVNLPRFRLTPQPVPAAGFEPVPAGIDAVLVSWVVLYYSHNAGWFIGQHYGCDAGARFRLLWALYDRHTGQPLTWRDASARTIAPRIFEPSTAHVDDFLMRVERQMQSRLKRDLP